MWPKIGITAANNLIRAHAICTKNKPCVKLAHATRDVESPDNRQFRDSEPHFTYGKGKAGCNLPKIGPDAKPAVKTDIESKRKLSSGP